MQDPQSLVPKQTWYSSGGESNSNFLEISEESDNKAKKIQAKVHISSTYDQICTDIEMQEKEIIVHYNNKSRVNMLNEKCQKHSSSCCLCRWSANVYFYVLDVSVENIPLYKNCMIK